MTTQPQPRGLFTATYAVAPQDRPEFDRLLALQREELRPQGINEELVFSNLVQAAWNSQKTRRLEGEALAEQNEAKLDRYSRYAAQFERAYYRALAELRKLQTERALRESTAPASYSSAPLANAAKLKKQTQSPATRDSFIDRMNAESRWAMVQLQAIKLGILPPEAAFTSQGRDSRSASPDRPQDR